jgi:hypothetical protein
MSEQEFQDYLLELLQEFSWMADDDRENAGFESADWLEGAQVRSFGESGVMSMNKGLFVRLNDQEFQLTIVRSR